MSTNDGASPPYQRVPRNSRPVLFICFCWCLQGTIDMRDIGELLDAVRLIEATDGAAWPAADEAALHAWFKTYIDDWLVSQARCP